MPLLPPAVRPLLFVLFVLCLLVPAGCRSAARREPALAARAFAPTSYEAEILSRALSLAELSELDAEPFERVEALPDDVHVDLKARLVATTAGVAEDALGWRPLEGAALIVERAAGDARLADLLARGEATELAAPRLSLVAGHGGYVTVSDQVAYLERYEVVSCGADCIADPAVAVAEQGFSLKAVPERPSAEGAIPLALELVLVSLEEPMRTRRVALPGTDHEVELQTPLSIGPDDLLILGGLPADEPGTFLFLFATCDVLAPGSP